MKQNIIIIIISILNNVPIIIDFRITYLCQNIIRIKSVNISYVKNK